MAYINVLAAIMAIVFMTSMVNSQGEPPNMTRFFSMTLNLPGRRKPCE